MKYILAFIGPSGSGKSTVADNLLSKYPNMFTKWKQVTTRAKRENEVAQYIYTTKEKYDVIKDKLTCRTEFNDNFYGTIPSVIEEQIVLTIVDVTGIDCLINFVSNHNQEILKTNDSILGTEEVTVIPVCMSYNINDDTVKLRGRESRGSAFILEEQRKIDEYFSTLPFYFDYNTAGGWLTEEELVFNINKDFNIKDHSNDVSFLQDFTLLSSIHSKNKNKDTNGLPNEDKMEALKKQITQTKKEEIKEEKVDSKKYSSNQVISPEDSKKYKWNDKYDNLVTFYTNEGEKFNEWLALDGNGLDAFKSKGTFRGNALRFLSTYGFPTTRFDVRCEERFDKGLPDHIKRFAVYIGIDPNKLYFDLDTSTKSIKHGLFQEYENETSKIKIANGLPVYR